MRFFEKNALIYVSLLGFSIVASGMELERLRPVSSANFVHLLELEENANAQLENALYSFEPDHVVLQDVERAIRLGADVKLPYRDGKTPLDKALEWPDLTIAEAIVEACPCSVNHCDEQGNTILTDAIAKKDVRTVKFLLRSQKINMKKGISPLKLVIDNARYNRPNVRGGLSCWPTTGELVCIIGKATSLARIEEAEEYLKTKPYNDHYSFYIRKPLSKIADEKERKRKGGRDDSNALPTKKRKITRDSSLYSSAPAALESVQSESKRATKTPQRFAPVTQEEANKKREKRLQLQRSHDFKRTKK